MGKGLNPALDTQGLEGSGSIWFWVYHESGLCKKSTLTWVVGLVLSLHLLVFAVLSLEPFGKQGHVSVPAPPPSSQSQVLATFVLQLPASSLDEKVAQLQAELAEELGVPSQALNLYVTLEEGGGADNTTVTFAVVPATSAGAEVVSEGIDHLRSALISIFLKESNITLSPFGNASDFQILKFPGGLTILPLDSDYSLDTSAVGLYSFTLQQNLGSMLKNYEQLKVQVSQFIGAVASEVVVIKLTNEAGSTVGFPVVVQVSLASSIPGKPVPQSRLDHLVQVVLDSKDSSNLGLNLSIFGDVESLTLAYHLLHHPTPAPSPGPAITTHPHPRPPQVRRPPVSHPPPPPSPAHPPPAPAPAPAPAPPHTTAAPKRPLLAHPPPPHLQPPSSPVQPPQQASISDSSSPLLPNLVLSGMFLLASVFI